MKIITKLIINSVAVYAAAYLVNGVDVDSFWTALVVCIVLGLLNTFVRPILMLLALPINFITLGLFTFVINALMVYIASNFVAGFIVSGFVSAIIFSVVLSIVSWFLSLLAK